MCLCVCLCVCIMKWVGERVQRKNRGATHYRVLFVVEGGFDSPVNPVHQEFCTGQFHILTGVSVCSNTVCRNRVSMQCLLK